MPIINRGAKRGTVGMTYVTVERAVTWCPVVVQLDYSHTHCCANK